MDIFAYPFIARLKYETQYLNRNGDFLSCVFQYKSLYCARSSVGKLPNSVARGVHSQRKYSTKVDYHNLWVKYESDTSLWGAHYHVLRVQPGQHESVGFSYNFNFNQYLLYAK